MLEKGLLEFNKSFFIEPQLKTGFSRLNTHRYEKNYPPHGTGF